MVINEREQFGRFLRYGIPFTLILVGLWFAGNWAADQIIDNFYELKYAELFDPEVNANVVILGSSKAVRGINPQFLNSAENTFFNFGFNASNPEFYLKWYDLAFRDNYPTPELIIYAVDWPMFIDGFKWREFEQDSEYLPTNILINAGLNDATDWKQMFFNRYPLIKDFERIGLKLLGQRNDYDYDLMEQYFQGYVPRSAEIQVRGFEAPPPPNTPNNPQQIANFETLLAQFSADGIPVLLIQIPEYIPDQAPDQDKLDLLTDIAQRNGLTYIDYNTVATSEINNNLDYFLDWAHMNAAGSDLFSQILRDDLDDILPQYGLGQ